MKEKGKKNLATKVKERIEELRTVTSEGDKNFIGIESQKNLEKLLENFQLAEVRLESAKKETGLAKGNKAVAANELQTAYKQVKKQLKKRSGSTKKKSKAQKKKN